MSLEFQMPMASLIFIIILLGIYFSKSRINLLENKYFEAILICSFFEILIDTFLHILSAINTYDNLMYKYYNLINFFDKILGVLFVVIFSSLLCYILIICYQKIRDNIQNLKNALVAFVGIFAIVITFTNIEIIEIGDIRNSIGSTVNITYGVVAILLILSLLFSLINIKKIYKKYFPILSIVFFMGTSYIVTIFLPGIVLYSFILALLCYMMYFTIENPDIKTIEKLNILKLQAESANNAKNEWLKQMRHEINTPATQVQAFNDFNRNIAHRINNKELLENTEYIDSGIKDIQIMISNAVSIANLENKELKLEEGIYKTEELIELVNRFSGHYHIGKKNIKFKMNVSKKIPKVLIGDKQNVLRIITSLLSNAFKYTNEGKIELNIKSEIKNNICELSIDVIDTGIGIQEDDMKDLFNKFVRIDFEHNQSDKRGVGLGLSIVKQLSELMEGSVKAESEYGQGSTFTVIIKQKLPNRSKMYEI